MHTSAKKACIPTQALHSSWHTDTTRAVQEEGYGLSSDKEVLFLHREN